MGRGPSYPYVGLEESIVLSRKMYEYTKRSAADLNSVITEAWKYSPSSSSGQKITAALKSFGLIEEGSSAAGKTVKLTHRAIIILIDEENSEERRKELKAAALSPNWYSRCWKIWGKEMPPSMRSQLIIKEGFIDTTVDGFLKDYKKSLAFAGILEDAKESQQGESNGSDEDGGTDSARLDDVVHSSSQETIRSASQALKDANWAGGTKANVAMQTEKFSLPNGISIQVEWLPTLTLDAVEDFDDYLKSLLRRVKRSVTVDPAKVETDEKTS